MQVLVNGVRLFFDVEGASLVPDGRTMREKATLILLHGGPGFDHSIYKPTFSALADKLILVSTEAAGGMYRERRVALFERFGGPEVGALARRRFLEGHTDEATLEAWLRLAFPLYTRSPRDPAVVQRAVRHPEVTHWFTRPGGEGHTFNLFPALSRVQCPTLVLGGEEDPMTPIECQMDIAAALPAHLVRFERFAGCGHGVLPDAPERAMAVIRDFIVH